LYIGPLEVTELIGTKAIRVGLPEGYHVNNAFNYEDVRPWLSHSAQELEPHYPQVQPAPSCNPIISVVDRRALPGRIPQDVDPLDIPCEYLTLRKNGDLAWISSSHGDLEDAHIKEMVVNFECRYPWDSVRPCNPIVDYPEFGLDYDSPDEYPLALRRRVQSAL
jgi:hypothetical protein